MISERNRMETKIYLGIFLLAAAHLVNAGGVMKTGGMIGPHPETFSERFNELNNGMMDLFPRISIVAGKTRQTKDLGNGITLSAKLVKEGDIFENVRINCNTLAQTQRINNCLVSMYYTAIALDSEIDRLAFMNAIQTAIKKMHATYNQNGVDYFITVNRKQKSVSMFAKSDMPMQIEAMDDSNEAYMKSDKCNPEIELCIKP